MSSESKYPKRLKLKIEKFPIAALKDASDINRLAKRLIECAIGNKDIGLKDGLFKEYHTALASEVINVKDKKFKTGFIDNDNLSEKAQKFREVLLAKGNLSQKEFEIKMKDINLKLSSTFGKGFKPDDSPRVTNPREFSEAIVNAIKNANNNIVIIKREPSKAGIIKDNINKLAGYVLIEKDDGETNTYYFSPTFFDDSHKLPGNLEDFKSKLKAELKNKNIDFDKEKYKFHIANFQTCKEGQLHTKFELPDDHVTEAEIESFFEKLVFAVNQPNEIELGKILEAKISREFSEKFNYIGSISRDAYNKFQIEVLNWMKEKEGRFLSNEKVKEFFMETEQQISTLSIIEKEVKKANGKIDGVEKIVESNNKILKEVHSIVEEKSNQQTQGSIWFGMIYPVRSFTGRTSVLETLHDALEDRQVAIPQMVSIAGLGGVGKSELARKYAYSYSKDYDNNVIWVNAGTQETLKESFQELAKKKLRIPTIDANGEEKDIEDIIIDAYNYFKSVKSLFIFDDAKSYEDIKEFLPSNLSPDNRKPYVLITSCSRKWKTEEGVEIQVKILNDFSLPEAMQFIKGTLGIDNRLQDNEVKNLAEVLQCFPLALQEAVWCITSSNRSGESLSIEDYIKEYKRTELLDSEEDRNEKRIGTVFATLKITLKNIKQNGNHGKKALEILNIMAYLAPNNLPLEIFFLTLTEDQKKLTQKAIDLLCQYSMINVDDVVSRIHGLVQEVIKVELKEKKGEEEVLKQTFKLLERTFSDNTRNIYTVDHLLVEHLRVFCSHIYHWSKDGVNKKSIEKSYFKNLLIWRAKVYGRFRAFEQKKELLNEALSIDPEDAIARAELGVAYESLGDYKKQKEYLEQALGIFKKNHDQNDLQVAVVEAKLGKAYGNLKQYEEQKKYLEQSLDVFKKNHNRNDLQIATVKVELGKAYGNLGEYRKQKKYLEQALGVFEKHYPNIPSESLKYFIFWKYPIFLRVRYCLDYELLEGYNSFSFLQVIDVKVELSEACENLGEYQKQKEYLEQVLSSLEELRVRDDFRVAIMKAGLGRAYGNLEQYEEQKEHLKQALDIFDKCHAEKIDPFQVAVTKLNLGRAYSHLNIHNKQKKYLEQALDIYRNHDIDDVQVAITKVELGKACQEDSLERKHYLKQALDVLEELYDYDDREAIEELKKELYKDKPQLNEQEKLTAYEKQKRRLARTIRTSEENYSKSSSQASSGSVEPDETVKNSLKYNKFQYAIVLRDLAKVLRDSNMKTSKKDRYARYIMLLQEAKGIFREYYGANHFYVATVLIRLSLYNNEINHMLQQMNVYHKNDESKNDLRSALNIFEKHYNDNYFRVNAEKLVKVSYPNSIHQESEVLAGECLPSISRNRKKREVESECLFTWEDVDEFNVEKDEKRDFNKIEIDSKKFVNYIKGLPEEKRSQLIELADKVKVTGKSQGLIYKLTNNKKVMNHLSRIGKISGMTMHGMMAKNVLADFVNGDYQGVAINVGFIAGGQGFAKVAEAASLKGLKLAAEGKFLLGRSLKAASPFLARGTSAFVVYDLINQIKEFKNGTEEALVSVVDTVLQVNKKITKIVQAVS
ncbi:NB-ARC domain-containing protein [Wolbachia endosymbiont (group B) of Eucosma cana]|uniref:NB-ARC domain-containing protein n=1 Tax=Wolbachia endosymbiont (group B) of Eucosma cana TaxID=2954012 RepID=UPI002227F4F8|nr:NB-ARC domain-containing protein [Wolbachia endosymbiont (group B) of Eucosma cana]